MSAFSPGSVTAADCREKIGKVVLVRSLKTLHRLSVPIERLGAARSQGQVPLGTYHQNTIRYASIWFGG